MIHTGDTLLAVGTALILRASSASSELRSDEDLMKAPGQVTFKRVIVTNKPMLGKTCASLDLRQSTACRSRGCSVEVLR